MSFYSWRIPFLTLYGQSNPNVPYYYKGQKNSCQEILLHKKSRISTGYPQNVDNLWIISVYNLFFGHNAAEHTMNKNDRPAILLVS